MIKHNLTHESAPTGAIKPRQPVNSDVRGTNSDHLDDRCLEIWLSVFSLLESFAFDPKRAAALPNCSAVCSRSVT